MTDINSILLAYQVNPLEIIQISKRTYKIQCRNYCYALKRSKLTKESIHQWKNVFEVANKHGLTSILPIYLTKSGNLFYEDNEEFYYLCPWIETKELDEPEHELESFYLAIGEVHQKTKTKITIDTDRVEHVVNQEKKRIQVCQRKLLRYVETFERRRYMTPFELRVCMQYRDMERVFAVLNNWFDYYLLDIQEEGYVYRSLCHGNLRPSHQLYESSRSYIINWEHSFYGSPMTDLYSYYFHELKYHDAYLDDMIQALAVYEKTNPLLKNERCFLAIQLLNPEMYLSVLEKYYKKEYQVAQPLQIKQLEYAYRRVIHGLQFQDHLYQRREEIKEKELAKENQDAND
ncbi:phosphotransferase [Aquibacillus salsiterrae]|uniref:Phosphotransferase n=1 Tax=Aquibacillus salsiterrae TaxID=2950439 RepID=A0A9X3WCV7_9BACI|nr:phosphotransferase [Aquibacillus salsiterrae]MDC3415680.1 phosphotransferase [Aquibacillus salsiterrae]